ncbi:MAG TPA: acyltransferase family protein [Aeromicrobium sp.]|nr:acyltransferase family protein [Aeromicrobium sp.]
MLPAIQGMRGVAMIVILMHHAKLPIYGGFVAVDTFFVVSGFVITRLMLGKAEAGSFSLVDFYVRRARRLLPALALTLVVVVLAAAVILSPQWPLPVTIQTAKWAAIGAANFGILRADANYFTPGVYHPLLHTWSLGVEEQFYVVFGVLVVICFWWAKRTGRRLDPIIAWLSAIVLVVSLTICVVASLRSPADFFGATWGFYHPLARAWEFAIGALLASTWRWGLSNRWLAWAGFGLIAGSMAFLRTDANHPGLVTIIPVVGTAVLIAGATDSDGLVGRALRSRWPVWIGDRSYSIYLWHWPFIVFAQALGGSRLAVVVAGFASIPVAAATYRWWENPIRRGRVRLPRAALVPVAVTATALLTAFGVQQLSARVINTGPVKAFGIQTVNADFKGAECSIPVPVSARDLRPCTFVGSSSNRPIILLGDSNAGQFAAGLVKAGLELKRTTILATTPGCSFVLLDPPVRDACAGSAPDALHWLKTQPPSVVVAANANWVGTGYGETWYQGLRRTYEQVERQGHIVVHVMSLPHFATVTTKWEPTSCTLLAVRRDPARCGRTASVASLERPWREGLDAEAKAVADAKVHTINLDDVVCPNGTCRTNVGNRWIFRDGTHITIVESDRLAPYFVKALRNLP